MDDAENTDHAWLETAVYHFHCPRPLGLQLPLLPTPDKEKACAGEETACAWQVAAVIGRHGSNA